MKNSTSSEETLIYPNAPKKMLLPILLEILSKTDKEYPISQKKIIDILEHTYLMNVDRKTVGRNLHDLATYHKNVFENDEIKQRSYINQKTGEEIDSSMTTGYFMQPLFDDTELQVLIYSVIFSKQISPHIKNKIVKRLESLTYKDFSIKMNNFSLIPSSGKNDYSLFSNLDTLNKAIAKHQKVSFRRKYIGPDKAPFIQDKLITFTPFKIASSNNDFYVVGTEDFENIIGHNMTRYRIDSITDLKISDEIGVSLQEVYGIEKRFDFNAFLSQSPTIVPSEQIRAKMTIVGLQNLSAAIDYFSQESIVNITEEEPNEEKRQGDRVYTVTVRCVDNSLCTWAGNPFNWSYVIEPTYIREMLADTFQARAEAYNDMDSSTTQNITTDESE